MGITTYILQSDIVCCHALFGRVRWFKSWLSAFSCWRDSIDWTRFIFIDALSLWFFFHFGSFFLITFILSIYSKPCFILCVYRDTYKYKKYWKKKKSLSINSFYYCLQRKCVTQQSLYFDLSHTVFSSVLCLKIKIVFVFNKTNSF